MTKSQLHSLKGTVYFIAFIAMPADRFVAMALFGIMAIYHLFNTHD